MGSAERQPAVNSPGGVLQDRGEGGQDEHAHSFDLSGVAGAIGGAWAPAAGILNNIASGSAGRSARSSACDRVRSRRHRQRPVARPGPCPICDGQQRVPQCPGQVRDGDPGAATKLQKQSEAIEQAPPLMRPFEVMRSPDRPSWMVLGSSSSRRYHDRAGASSGVGCGFRVLAFRLDRDIAVLPPPVSSGLNFGDESLNEVVRCPSVKG